MKILTGTKSREIKISKGENLFDYLEGLWRCNKDEDVLVLKNSDGKMEKNLLLTITFPEMNVIRIILKEPSVVISIIEGQKNFEEYFQRLKEANLI